MPPNFNVCVLSDSSGETATVVLRSVAAQLPEIKIDYSVYPLIRTTLEIDHILQDINPENSIIMCTIADEVLLDSLRIKCKDKNIRCIEVLSRIIQEMAEYFQTVVSHGGRQIEEENAYFNRVEGFNFTLKHDDGQNLETAYKADIIVVGTSRTSKSPTSLYLANRGYKVANIPFVANHKFPELKIKNSKALIVGLTIDPTRLQMLRKKRIFGIGETDAQNYVNIHSIIEESKEAELFFRKMAWPVIDVTERSVEEISAIIIKMAKQ